MPAGGGPWLLPRRGARGAGRKCWMLVAPRNGTEAVQALAGRLGCRTMEHMPSFGLSRPAVVGASTELARQLKAHGGRWNNADRAITFMTWPQLEGVLRALVDEA